LRAWREGNDEFAPVGHPAAESARGLDDPTKCGLSRMALEGSWGGRGGVVTVGAA
jgi:hypothetical protein